MEFGKLESVDRVNWTLPPDDTVSIQFLCQLPRNPSLQIYFGAPAWAHKEWIGSLYPQNTKASDYLYYYSRVFSCIELNTSHYRIPNADQTRKWTEQTPKHFQFCSKITKEISHRLQGMGDKELLRYWFNYLTELKERQGPSFLQLPPYFDYSKKILLFNFLKNWSDEFPLAIELRHPSWFQGPHLLPALTEYLQRRHIGLVITDVAGRRDVLHSSISAPFTMIRFIGNNLHPSDEQRMKDWKLKLETWKSQGLQKAYYFLHQPEDLMTPQAKDLFVKIYSDSAEFLIHKPEELSKKNETMDFL